MVVLSTSGDSRRSWLDAGLARVLLTATVEGVAAQPLTAVPVSRRLPVEDVLDVVGG